jgi:hypothetical protein
MKENDGVAENGNELYVYGILTEEGGSGKQKREFSD